MDFSLSEEHIQAQKMVRDFADREIIPTIGEWDRKQEMNPAVLLGAVAGACTNSAGMRVAEEDTHSAVPAIGFPVPFAIGTILLTLAGYVLMLF